MVRISQIICYLDFLLGGVTVLIDSVIFNGKADRACSLRQLDDT